VDPTGQPEAPSSPTRLPLGLRLALAGGLPLLLLLLPDPPPGSAAALRGVGPETLLPAVAAIALAFATGRTILPLLGGVVLGAGMVAWGEGVRWLVPLAAVGRTAGDYVVAASIYDFGGGGFQGFKISVVGFVFALVGMVAVTIRAGGMAGVAERFAVLARSARATRLATWAMGLVIFFDDYANTLVIGGSMRPLADRNRVSREKLAWIVDSTAAPVAGLSILSTWVAYEVSQFSPQLPLIGRSEAAGYAVFLQTIPFRFYCIFTLIFVGLVCATGRDFGPMRRAERRAATTGATVRPGGRPMSGTATIEAECKAGIPHRARLALLPVGLTLATIAALFVSTGEVDHPEHARLGLSGLDHLRAVLQGVGASSTRLLFAGSTVGLLVAVLLALRGRALTLKEALKASVSGWRAMLIAVSVLLLAWAMSEVCGDLGTREYMAALSARTSPLLLPAGLFGIACAVSFATGSSWSTMGILLPIVIKLAADVGADAATAAGLEPTTGATAMVIVTIGAVLDGSIFGDHCSPISDTTILSSTAAGSDHMDHVKTQAPYAITVAVVAVGCGYLPAAAGVHPAICLGLGVAALVGVVALLGRR
jgi:Na+/H+ antiporter NhaC